MQSPFPRTAVLCVGIVLEALCFALAVRPSASVRGVAAPLMRLAESPPTAVLWLIACFLVGIVIACVVGRLINAVVGLFVLGCGVGLYAMRCGNVQELVFSGTPVSALAIETLAWGLAVLLAAVVVFRASGPLPDAVEITDPAVDGPFSMRAIATQIAGVAVLVVIWFVAVTPAKGQSLGAVTLGATVVGLVGRLLAPRTPPILIFAAPLLFCAVGELVAHFLVKGAPVDALFIQRQLSRLAYPMPADIAAGSLAGTALGVGWARSFLKVEATPKPRTA